MNINSPISHVDEIEALVLAGAKELYCGVVPSNWVAQFNTGAVNRRYFGNLPSLVELEKAVTLTHALGAKMSLVLNAQHYAAGQLEALVELGSRFQQMGGDAAIVADLTLLMALRAATPELALHVSSVASCRNSAAVNFYQELGARRVILPRDVTLAEIEAIATHCTIEIETFILNDGCVFEEGVCHTIHLPKKLGGPICIDSYQFEYVGAAGKPMPPALARSLLDNDEDYKRWLWYRFGCGFSTTEEGYPYGPCGLCAIHRMQKAGVASIKIAGREGATARKLKSVEMVQQVLAKVNSGCAEADAADTALAIRKTLTHCQSGYMCYYPEVRASLGATNSNP